MAAESVDVYIDIYGRLHGARAATVTISNSDSWPS